MISSIADAVAMLKKAWPHIVEDCRSVLGSELHYQAMIYHCLRQAGVARGQIGMNVKQWIDNPVSGHFKALDLRKHEDFHGGFEPIPDIVVFKPDIAGDWRRRNCQATCHHMVMAIEVKASERSKGRLRSGEIRSDILKLAAHREEVRYMSGDMHPVILIVDTAPLESERMTSWSLSNARATATENSVSLLYVSSIDEDMNWVDA